MFHVAKNQPKNKLSRSHKNALIFIFSIAFILVAFLAYSAASSKVYEPFNAIVLISLSVVLLAGCLYSLNKTHRITLRHIMFFVVWIIVGLPISFALHFFNTLVFVFLFILLQMAFYIMFNILIARTPKR